MRQKISGSADSTGKDSELNINIQVLMQVRISIGNWQKWLEDGVITDRSATNQQES